MDTERHSTGRGTRLGSVAAAKFWSMAAAAGLSIASLAACSTPPGTEPVPNPQTTGAGPQTPPQGVTTTPMDAGSEYYGQFENPLPDDPDYFPLALWHESLTDAAGVEADQSFGINTYVEVTHASDTSLAWRNDMYVLSSLETSEQNGFTLPDEVDMWGKSGDGIWTGAWPGEAPVCEPEVARCGYTVMNQSLAKAPEGLAVYANFGKGVTFWEADGAAKKFVNSYADIVSADNYWFTDPYICGETEGGTRFETPRMMTVDECRLAANYGWTVTRMRTLVEPAGSKPVWGFVEIGQPFDGGPGPVSTEQIRAAVWHSIIAGARGIVYFNHSFGGECQSQHVLRDCGAELSAGVQTVNTQVTSLAPVINSASLHGFITHDAAVATTVRRSGDSYYVFGASAQNGPQEAAFQLACPTTTSLSVLDENREISVKDGAFTDTFTDGNSVHIYRLPAAGC